MARLPAAVVAPGSRRRGGVLWPVPSDDSNVYSIISVMALEGGKEDHFEGHFEGQNAVGGRKSESGAACLC